MDHFIHTISNFHKRSQRGGSWELEKTQQNTFEGGRTRLSTDERSEFDAGCELILLIMLRVLGGSVYCGYCLCVSTHRKNTTNTHPAVTKAFQVPPDSFQNYRVAWQTTENVKALENISSHRPYLSLHVNMYDASRLIGI